MRALKYLLAVSALCLTSGSAFAACYEPVYIPESLTCSGKNSNSADFSSPCTHTLARVEQREIQCPYTWVNTPDSSGYSTHAATCASAGKTPTSINGQICMSGERRTNEGQNAGGVNFKFGTWGATSVGGRYVDQYYQAGGMQRRGNDNYEYVNEQRMTYCYTSGQKRDSDSSDIAVAYVCR